MNFRGGVRASLAKKFAAVIGLSSNELRRSADFTKEIVAAEVFHEILAVRRHTEGDA